MIELPAFLDGALADKQLEQTPHEAYRRVIWVLQGRLRDIETAMLDSRKRGDRSLDAAASFFDLGAQRAQILEDIEIVTALLRRLDGLRPLERVEPPRRDPRKGYGER